MCATKEPYDLYFLFFFSSHFTGNAVKPPVPK